MQGLGDDFRTIGSIAKAAEEHQDRGISNASTTLSSGGALETVLAGIWQRVLGVPDVGLNDNFFEAGGTSLRAVQVIAAIKKELKRDLSIVDLFECPTVALLAAKFKATSEIAPIDSASADAVLRGQQRRHKAARRRTS
jgi:acyl carrier protein